MQPGAYPNNTILATVYESTAKMKGPYPGWDKVRCVLEPADVGVAEHIAPSLITSLVCLPADWLAFSLQDMHFVVSDDFFKSKHRTLVPCGNQFEVGFYRLGPQQMSEIA